MNTIIKKTLGGLSKEYYARQFLFGLIFPALLYFVLSQGEKADSLIVASSISFWIISCFLYPYSRFVYENIVKYIIGNNMFITAVPLMSGIKFFTMAMCWGFAFLIAPVGLLYLYYYHTKEEKKAPDDALLK